MVKKTDLISYCAIFCPNCHQYQKINSKNQRYCYGCRSTKPGSKGYLKLCQIKTCCQEKKIKYCCQCQKYPCQKILNHRNLKIGQSHRCYRHTLFERMELLKNNKEEKKLLKQLNNKKYCFNLNKPPVKCFHQKITLKQAKAKYSLNNQIN